MSPELVSRHDPGSIEPKWIDAWARERVGHADPRSKAALAG